MLSASRFHVAWIVELTFVDTLEYMRAKTVDLPKKFLDRGRI